ncbi:hypothetical protein F183_A07930 [Bryobacterales bacterium F-183]|nr:hypothetical protein F183_A07930 [Bryobacterales bacterium F-183]
MNLSRYAARIMPLLLGLAVMPSAKADLAFDFTITLNGGLTQGMITGNLLLPFVSAGGSGTGAASVVTLTSVPAGFDVFTAGNTVTSWAFQPVNSFTVTNGSITSFVYFAATSLTFPAQAFGINSTVQTRGPFGDWILPAGVNALQTSGTKYGSNSLGLAGVSFTPVALTTVPEPSSLGWALACTIGLAAARKRMSK